MPGGQWTPSRSLYPTTVRGAAARRTDKQASSECYDLACIFDVHINVWDRHMHCRNWQATSRCVVPDWYYMLSIADPVAGFCGAARDTRCPLKNSEKLNKVSIAWYGVKTYLRFVIQQVGLKSITLVYVILKVKHLFAVFFIFICCFPKSRSFFRVSSNFGKRTFCIIESLTST